ncbi:uncharacterized protein [Musca autumnalis]|uniref:uncharacterized protein n=1 Tax=Musca autumnalis TaxID=221902 RepID=UPI003CFAC85B
MPRLRSGRARSVSPVNGAPDELNATMREAPPPIEYQLMGVIEGLRDLNRAVVESRTDITSLRKQMDDMEERISRTAMGSSSSTRNDVQLPERNISDQNVAGQPDNSNAEVREEQVPSRNVGDAASHHERFVYAEGMCKLYDLPPFTGNADEWPLFIANFNDTTEAFRYSHRQNLMRLQKCLSGPAKEAVSSMLIYPNDVPKVIEEDILVRSQILKVKQFPNICKKKLDQIISFSTTVRNVVAFLTSAGCQHHLMSTTLLEEMVSKLPVEHQFQWAREAAKIKPFPTVSDFCKWLGDLAKVVGMMPCSSSSLVQPPNKMMILDKTKNVKEKCEICKGDHIIAKCRTFIEKIAVPERWEKVKKFKLCFSCLHKGHGTTVCRFKKTCGLDGCPRFHHKLLHDDKTVADNATQMLNCRHPHGQLSKLFKVVPIKLYGPSGYLKAYAMFDEGSSISLIDENTARLLGLKGKYSDLTLQWYGEKVVKEKSFRVSCQIEGTHDKAVRYELKNVHTVNELRLPVQSFSKSEHPGLASLPVEEYVDATPVILLGLDNAFLGVPSDVKEFENLIALQSKLGWLIYGGTGYTNNQPTVLHLKDDVLQNVVQEFISNEKFGTNPDIVPLVSDDDQKAMNIMESTTKKTGDRFEIGLLWKEYPPIMPNSLQMAQKRLITIEKKMGEDSEYAEKYKSEIKKYIEKGYARKLREEEVADTRYPVWYLPHFGITNPHKPEKLRVVFDAAAKIADVSLNSCLLKGPEQAKPLLGILLKFRQGTIAVAADIRELFSQIRIREEDQHSQRFLWRNGNTNEPVQHFVMVTMIFGAICSSCCAEYIKNCNATDFAQIYPDAAGAIIEKHYVDDFVASFRNEAEAIEICKQVVSIHAKGGFELRGFVSNSKYIENSMNGATSQNDSNVNMEKQSSADKILGMVKHECLTCKVDSVKPIIPQMGQLPPDRVTPFVRPFTYTGVDLCGPFDVTIGRRKEKRWAVVFTCLTVRAAHIELAHDLSTDAFILCLRNFINRRGTPVRIRSDNGTNFIGAQKLLNKEEQLINEHDLFEEASSRNIEWIFNCPDNPSSGGAWERLIQIIKRLLQKTLKESSPRVETLQSVLIEAENIINSRPLTEVPVAAEDDEPLTPNHFLIGCLNSTQTPNGKSHMAPPPSSALYSILPTQS